MTESKTSVTFDEIRKILTHLPDANSEAESAARARQQHLTKPPGSLGRLEDLAIWMAAWQGRAEPELTRPRVAVFAANHGVAFNHKVSAYPAEVTAQMVQNFLNHGAAVNQISDSVDAQLRVYEMALEHPTNAFPPAPPWRRRLRPSHGHGMMAVDEGVHLLALGEMGIGNTTSASALCCALFGGKVTDWVGAGTGIDQEGRRRKIQVIEAGLASNADDLADPLSCLRRLGGYELAAIVGAILAARMARIPVLLDGFVCTAAAATLHRLSPHSLDHCLVAHRSVEPGHSRLIEILGKTPLFDFSMRLGEASGAALAIPILRAAVACHNGMATFEQAGVSGPADESRETA
ncbi:Nicotinate-nucleotide--dimethylbenzimidazole phosphoribosyltransferase [Azospirillaceae bacterium]